MVTNYQKREDNMTPFIPNSLILYVDDIAVSTAFYRKILIQEPVETFEDFSVFSLTESFILGLQAKHTIEPHAPAHYGGFELCLGDISKEAVDMLYAEWKSNDILILMEPAMLDFGYTFVASDPDGHRLRVCATDTTNIPTI